MWNLTTLNSCIILLSCHSKIDCQKCFLTLLKNVDSGAKQPALTSSQEEDKTSQLTRLMLDILITDQLWNHMCSIVL
jgi:hypothetical protein